MTDKPPAPDGDKLPEAEADERFRRLIGNLVNSPHQPHELLSGRQKAMMATLPKGRRGKSAKKA